ncbi:MAG: hypothetical protein C4308_00145 [Chitinophagaceae bacterium]
MGIQGTPLVISTGVQHTPELRSFKNDDRQKGATRLYAGLMLDLPLFNLWTKSELLRVKENNNCKK